MDVQEELLKSVDTLIQERLGGLNFNYYLEGAIKVVNADGTYITTINGEDYTLKTREGLNFSAGDIVDVIVRNGNFSRKFIEGKRVV